MIKPLSNENPNKIQEFLAVSPLLLGPHFSLLHRVGAGVFCHTSYRGCWRFLFLNSSAPCIVLFCFGVLCVCVCDRVIAYTLTHIFTCDDDVESWKCQLKGKNGGNVPRSTGGKPQESRSKITLS